MQRGLSRKIGVIAGLLAILMATLAPAISQALVHAVARQGAVESMLASYCSGDARAHEAHEAERSRTPHTAPQPHDASSTGKHTTRAFLQACGYCALAAHTPALLNHARVVVVVNARAIAVLERRAAPAPYARITAAQPRAPPAFV